MGSSDPLEAGLLYISANFSKKRFNNLKILNLQKSLIFNTSKITKIKPGLKFAVKPHISLPYTLI